MLHMNNPWGLLIIYLGFGAGLAVFMFTGFVKSIPLEIEEAAMIDGCTPIQTFFQVVTSDHEANMHYRSDSAGHVDLERLSACHIWYWT